MGRPSNSRGFPDPLAVASHQAACASLAAARLLAREADAAVARAATADQRLAAVAAAATHRHEQSNEDSDFGGKGVLAILDAATLFSFAKTTTASTTPASALPPMPRPPPPPAIATTTEDEASPPRDCNMSYQAESLACTPADASPWE